MTRLFIFLFSYCIIVITLADLLFYLNYSALGYNYAQIALFILQSADFMMLLVAILLLLLTVCVPSP